MYPDDDDDEKLIAVRNSPRHEGIWRSGGIVLAFVVNHGSRYRCVASLTF
jgi:hypothetical protein